MVTAIVELVGVLSFIFLISLLSGEIKIKNWKLYCDSNNAFKQQLEGLA